MEGFTELKDYPNYWIAHSPPRLIHTKGDRIYHCMQTPNSKKDNYWTTTLQTHDGRFVKRSIHRLLMETFIPNPENKKHVNHIDGDKSNNSLDNLEWVTEKENVKHAIELGLTDLTKSRKAVHQYTLGGQYVASYVSDVEAEAHTFIPKQNISKVTLGLRVHAGYFQWSRSKTDHIAPVTTKYIKSYFYMNMSFNSLRELALFIGYPVDTSERMTFKSFAKKYRQNIKKVFYD